MTGTEHPLPGKDLPGYLHAYVEEMAFGSDDPAEVVERYHSPDFEQVNDGVSLDCGKLAAHARPARKNVLACRVEVHQALVDGDQVAAHYTLRTDMRKGPRLRSEVYMFGRLAPDGRLSRVFSTSSTEPEDA